jgi:hypothetical protein
MIVAEETLPKTGEDLLMKNETQLQSQKIKHQQNYRKQIKTQQISGICRGGGEERGSSDRWKQKTAGAVACADHASVGSRKADGDMIGIGGGR